MSEFYLRVEEESVGPLTIPQLRARGISPDAWVWKVGSPDWQPAREVRELRDVIDHRAHSANEATVRPLEVPGDARGTQTVLGPLSSTTVKTSDGKVIQQTTNGDPSVLGQLPDQAKQILGQLFGKGFIEQLSGQAGQAGAGQDSGGGVNANPYSAFGSDPGQHLRQMIGDFHPLRGWQSLLLAGVAFLVELISIIAAVIIGAQLDDANAALGTALNQSAAKAAIARLQIAQTIAGLTMLSGVGLSLIGYFVGRSAVKRQVIAPLGRLGMLLNGMLFVVLALIVVIALMVG